MTLDEGSWTAQGDHAEVDGCALDWLFTTPGSASPGLARTRPDPAPAGWPCDGWTGTAG